MPGTFTISGASVSEPAGQRIFGPLSIIGTTMIGETLELTLNSGDNTVVVPANAVACMILAPSSATATIKLRTNANPGDAGLTLHGTGYPTVYPFPATIPTSLIINASVSVGPLTIAFI